METTVISQELLNNQQMLNESLRGRLEEAGRALRDKQDYLDRIRAVLERARAAGDGPLEMLATLIARLDRLANRNEEERVQISQQHAADVRRLKAAIESAEEEARRLKGKLLDRDDKIEKLKTTIAETDKHHLRAEAALLKRMETQKRQILELKRKSKAGQK